MCLLVSNKGFIVAVDNDAASATLRDIEQTQRLTKKLISYKASSTFVLLWGILVSCGFIWEHFHPELASLSWSLVRTVGILVGFALAYVMNRKHRSFTDLRLLYAFLATAILGWLWTALIPGRELRALDVHWTLIFMFCLVISGMWIGRTFVVIGLSVIALTLVGLFYIHSWFHIWMAVCNGGGMILSGLWLRSRGVSRFADQ